MRQANIFRAQSVLLGLAPVLRQLGVTRVWLFGSRVNIPVMAVDWDLLFDFPQGVSPAQYWPLKQALIRSFAAPVDISSPQYCDPAFIAMIQPDLVLVYHG